MGNESKDEEEFLEAIKNIVKVEKQYPVECKNNKHTPVDLYLESNKNIRMLVEIIDTSYTKKIPTPDVGYDYYILALSKHAVDKTYNWILNPSDCYWEEYKRKMDNIDMKVLNTIIDNYNRRIEGMDSTIHKKKEELEETKEMLEKYWRRLKVLLAYFKTTFMVLDKMNRNSKFHQVLLNNGINPNKFNKEFEEIMEILNKCPVCFNRLQWDHQKDKVSCRCSSVDCRFGTTFFEPENEYEEIVTGATTLESKS